MTKPKIPSTPSTPSISSPDARTVVPGREIGYHNEPTSPSARGVELTSLPKSKPPSQRKHQRVVRISVVLPVTVELLVGTDDAKPREDSDWEILSVRSTSCEAGPRLVEENMAVEDFAALARLAVKAKAPK